MKPSTLHAGSPESIAMSLQLEAFDGTAGRQGPRDYRRQDAATEPFPDPKTYLPRSDYKTYQKWVQWSQKPAGQDYVLPSREYFSLGKTKPLFGDLNEPGTIKQLIKARSYKNEIIQFVMSGARSMDIGLNLAFNLRDLGYDHWFIFGGHTNETCVLVQRVMPDAACVWNTILESPLKPEYGDQFGATSLIWWHRWWTMARLLRFGLNAALWDVDLVIHDDFYKYVKSEELRDANWICGDEGGFGPLGCNGGTNYFQNVAPDGPVAWAIANVVERAARCMDDWPAHEKLTPSGSAVDDQQTINSVLISMRTGYQVAPHNLRGIMEDWTYIEKLNRENGGELVRLPAPAEWAARHKIADMDIHRLNLTVPKPLSDLPEGVPSMLVVPRGPFVKHILKVLDEEAGAPPLPDADEPMNSRQPRALESLWKIHFMFNTWAAGYREGRWFGVKPVPVVLSHTVFIRSGYCRAYFFKTTGWYHWKVDDLRIQMDAQPAPYLASTSSQPLPRVVLYTPALTRRNITKAQFDIMLVNLLLVAALTDRVIVLPPIACDSDWVTEAKRKPCGGNHACWYHGIPWHWDGLPFETIPIIDERYPEDRLTCQAWRTFDDHCFSVMMFYIDFKHMMTRRLYDIGNASFATSAENTLWHAARDPYSTSIEFEEAVTDVAADELLASLQGHQNQHAVYLNAIPVVRGATNAAVTRDLPASGVWRRAADTTSEMHLAERVQKYLGSCSNGYGFEASDVEALLQVALS